MKINKKAQQEMVGFVLIVVIVIIGLFVLLLYAIGRDSTIEDDITNNMLSAIMKTSSECAYIDERNLETIRDLFRGCYDNRMCSNINEMSCDVLERTLEEILDEIMLLEPFISAYQIYYVHTDSLGIESDYLLNIRKGECEGNIYGSEPLSIRITTDESLIVQLRICTH